MLRTTLATPLLTIAICLGASSNTNAQASFAEGFDSLGSPTSTGPSALVADGWIFRSESEPDAGITWYYADSFQPQSGSQSLHLQSNTGLATGTPNPAASNWLILPELPGLAPGDEVRFWTRVPFTTVFPTASLEVRVSPTFGTFTGSTPFEVGDFTTLAGTIPAVPGGSWTEQVSVLPEAGRVAIRFVLDPAGGFTTGSFSIDGLTVGAPPPGPVPIPLPGQTVTWSTPITIDGGLTTIPAGGTVAVEPGVAVTIAAGSALNIEGNLEGAGSTVDPILLLGNGAVHVTGTVDLTNTDLACSVEVERGGSLLLAGCESTAAITSSSPLIAPVGVRPAFLRLEGCTFPAAGLQLEDAELLLVDCSFPGGGMSLSRTVFRFDGVLLTDSPGAGLILSGEGMPLYLDEVTITGAAEAGLLVTSGNIALGPNTTIQGNGVTAEIREGGFLPGLELPPTGNLDNRIRVGGDGDRFFPAVWSNLGLPYHVENLYICRSGSLEVGPGATVLLDPGAAIASDPSPFIARGLPDDRITFAATDPTLPWLSLTLPDRLDHCDISGAEVGASFPPSFGAGFVDSCTFTDNETAVFGAAEVTNSQFFANDIGVDGAWVGGQLGPNEFEGNATAVLDSSDATGNWWGDPSGPATPANPGGTGDPVAAGVPVVPFLPAAPDPNDAPPVVRLERAYWLLEPGEKIMLNWDAADDGTIVNQRVLFSAWGGPFTVIADGLPGDRRSLEWTVPDVGVALFTDPSRIRLEVTDDSGRVGWDETLHQVPSGTVDVDLSFTTLFDPEYPSNAALGDVCWDTVGGTLLTYEGTLLFDDTLEFDAQGGSALECLPGGLATPAVSTDLARVMVIARDGGMNRFEAHLSPYFAIRPDSRLEDTPPQVELLAPIAGQLAITDQPLAIMWQASDDVGLREISIQASYDGGRLWHDVATKLDPAATGFDWPIPPGSGFPSVQLRVVASDVHFQRTSTPPLSFSIVEAGVGPAFLRGDVNDSSTVDIADAVFLLASLFVPGSPNTSCASSADANDDGTIDISDAIAILASLFVSGSPPLPPPSVRCGLDPTPDLLGCSAAACP